MIESKLCQAKLSKDVPFSLMSFDWPAHLMPFAMPSHAGQVMEELLVYSLSLIFEQLKRSQVEYC